MSALRFEIDDWVLADDPDPRRACSSAEIVIVVDDIAATRLFDSWSRTVTDRARLPLYPMAEWFATNWWRLHAEAPYESGSQPPVEWRLSHDLAAIGGGFVWPRVRFASDDLTIQVSARALRNAPWEPVRHINDIQPARTVQVADFDLAVEELITVVLRRLEDLRINAEPLATIWADVLTERTDPELAEWRRWEARLGLDPDEAPDRVMRQIVELFERVGQSAASEITPVLNPKAQSMLRQLDALAVAPGIEATLPMKDGHRRLSPDVAPWDVGREMAHFVRAEIGQEAGPLQDHTICELLGMRADSFEQMPPPDVPIGLGVLFPSQRKTVLHFRKRNLPGRRFEAARFLGESLSAPEQDLWMPLTDRATARQKLQRAFAAELLAPIAEINEQIGDTRTPEKYEDVADRYGVSPLAIRSHLANHGLLASEEVPL